MARGDLLGWIILGGLLVLLILEAMLALIPYVRQYVEENIIKTVKKTGARAVRRTRGETSEESGDGQEDHHQS